MSLLKTPEVTPSRLLGLYRYLRHVGEPLSTEVLGARVWPRTTRKVEGSQQPFHQINLREMRELGLVEEGEGGWRSHSDLPEGVRSGEVDEATGALPLAVADLLFHGDDRNHDLAYALAWYLTQDPLRSPGDKNDLPDRAKSEGVGELTGLINDARFGTFRDWSCYLGFAWQHQMGGGLRLQVDPTAHVRSRLPAVLPDVNHAQPVESVLERLAQKSPVFEGGRYRVKVEEAAGHSIQPRHVSPTTSLSLFRLRDEGHLIFKVLSDGAAMLVECGNERERVTHLVRRSAGLSE